MGIRRNISTSAGTGAEKVRPGTSYTHVQNVSLSMYHREAYRRSFVTKSSRSRKNVCDLKEMLRA